MGIETGLILGLLGAGFLTLKTSEKLKKTSNEISSTIIALSYLPIIGMFYSGFSIAQNASLSSVANIYLGAFFLSIVLYIGFVYLLVKIYRQSIAEDGLTGL